MNIVNVNATLIKKLQKELLRKMYDAKPNGYIYNLYSGGWSSEFKGISEDDLWGECHYLERMELANWYKEHCIQLTSHGIDVIEKYDYDIDKYLNRKDEIKLAKNQLPIEQLKDIKDSKKRSNLALFFSGIAILVSILALVIKYC